MGRKMGGWVKTPEPDDDRRGVDRLAEEAKAFVAERPDMPRRDRIRRRRSPFAKWAGGCSAWPARPSCSPAPW